VRKPAGLTRKEMIVKRIIAAISFTLVAGSAFAQHSGPIERSPFDRPIPGMRDPLDARDPLLDRPSGGASLPDLPGNTDSPRMYGYMQPRPLPGERAPLVEEPFLEQAQPGPRPYWENDPLFIAPPH
jgi:hypothetical protein